MNKKKPKYFMCTPQPRGDGQFYVRFYSTGKWPWFQASVVCKNRIEAFRHFHAFAERCDHA